MAAIELTVNGRSYREEELPPTTTLLNYLRYRLGLTGTKEGCAEGDCGACTVAVIDPDTPGGPSYRAVNSCLILLPMVHGKSVVTVEGLKRRSTPHPVQTALVEELGSQCGYCTPGVIMSMFEACYREDLDDPWKLDDQMCGNLCRCTGYRPIRDATQQIAGRRPQDNFTAALEASQAGEPAGAVDYQRLGLRFWRPSTLDQLWSIVEAHPEARFVNGGTDLSLEITKRFQEPPELVSLEGLSELNRIETTKLGLTIGAGVRLTDLEREAAGYLPPLTRMLRFFGSRQIKHRATVGGNLCTASPIGDLAPVLMSLDAVANIIGASGRRQVPLTDFFPGYRQTALQPGEILESVEVPALPPEALATSYKVSKRQELDISTVSAGIFVLRGDDGKVLEARIAFGGMAATPARAGKLEASLRGQPWTRSTVERVVAELDRDFSPIDDHRGSAWYRRTVAKNLLLGFFEETQDEPHPTHSYRPTGTIGLGGRA